jgi:hypothetical protein
LRKAGHLVPQAQRELADLMEELAGVLTTSSAPSADKAHLAESAAHMAQAIQQRQQESGLAAARRRLEESALKAESTAPLATGIVRRILDALANLGI